MNADELPQMREKVGSSTVDYRARGGTGLQHQVGKKKPVGVARKGGGGGGEGYPSRTCWRLFAESLGFTRNSWDSAFESLAVSPASSPCVSPTCKAFVVGGVSMDCPSKTPGMVCCVDP